MAVVPFLFPICWCVFLVEFRFFFLNCRLVSSWRREESRVGIWSRFFAVSVLPSPSASSSVTVTTLWSSHGPYFTWFIHSNHSKRVSFHGKVRIILLFRFSLLLILGCDNDWSNSSSCYIPEVSNHTEDCHPYVNYTDTIPTVTRVVNL